MTCQIWRFTGRLGFPKLCWRHRCDLIDYFGGVGGEIGMRVGWQQSVDGTMALLTNVCLARYRFCCEAVNQNCRQEHLCIGFKRKISLD